MMKLSIALIFVIVESENVDSMSDIYDIDGNSKSLNENTSSYCMIYT